MAIKTSLSAEDLADVLRLKGPGDVHPWDSFVLPNAVVTTLSSLADHHASLIIEQSGLANWEDESASLRSQEVEAFLAPLDEHLVVWSGDPELLEPRHQALLALSFLAQLKPQEALDEPVTSELVRALEAVAGGGEWSSPLRPVVQERPYDSVDEIMLRQKEEAQLARLRGEEPEEYEDIGDRGGMILTVTSINFESDEVELKVALEERENRLGSDEAETWASLVDQATALVGASPGIRLTHFLSAASWAVAEALDADGSRAFLRELDKQVRESITTEMAAQLESSLPILSSLSEPPGDSPQQPPAPDLGL
jgi:hypothetical protein